VAPNFHLQDLHGNVVELASFRGKIVVLEWFSPTSQHSIYAWSNQGPLRALTSRALAQGLVWLTISSPGLGPDSSDLALHRHFALENHMRTPLLIDSDGSIARAYGAKTAPHMFVLNEKGLLVYLGALDNAPRGYVDPDTGPLNYVEEAIKDMRAGNAVLISETPPNG
jgi:peroxiredoxin